MSQPDPNLENIVLYIHREELTAIDNGDAAYTHFTPTRIKGLHKHGVLTRERIGAGGSKTVLTAEARRILHEAEEEEQ